MVKTIILDGSETKVEGLGERNTLVVNNSSDTVYASRYPDVEAYKDDVIAIKAGSRDVIPETYGVVYLLGTGSVECRGVRYVNFNQPSSASGTNPGGGGSYELPPATKTTLGGVKIGDGIEVTPSGVISVKMGEDAVATVEETNEMLNDVFGMGNMMPELNGITGYFSATDYVPGSTKLDNKIPGHSAMILNNVAMDADALHFSTVSKASALSDAPVVIYAIVKMNRLPASKYAAIVSSKQKDVVNGTGFDLQCMSNSSEIAPSHMILGAVNSEGITYTEDVRKYHVYAASFDADKQIVSGYLDGVKIGSSSNFVFPPYDSYDGQLCVNYNSFYDTNINYAESGDFDLKMLAVGAIPHGEDQILANSKWLIRKYNIGG